METSLGASDPAQGGGYGLALCSAFKKWKLQFSVWADLIGQSFS